MPSAVYSVMCCFYTFLGYVFFSEHCSYTLRTKPCYVSQLIVTTRVRLMELDDEIRSSSLKWTQLTRDTWQPFAKQLIALFGIKGCRIPLRVKLADVVVATYPACADRVAA